MSEKLFNRNLLYKAILVAIILLMYLPMLNMKYYVHYKQEFGTHAFFADQWAKDIALVPAYILAHPGLEFLELVLIKLIGMDGKGAGYLISALAYVWLAILLYDEAYRRFKEFKSRPWLWSLGLALCLMIVDHIPTLLFVDRNIYFGYFGINVYNNSTSNLIKPFVLASFLYTVRIFEKPRAAWWQIAISSFLIIAATLIKPSYTICILPAVGVLAVYKLYRRQEIDWGMAIAGLVVPAVLILAWQYWINYSAGLSNIYFAPLLVMYYYSDALIIKFFSSVLFPLLTSRVYIREALQDTKMVLVWLTFIPSITYAYLLAENSSGKYSHGNLAVGVETTLFLLFVITTLFFVERKREKPAFTKLDTLLAAVFTLHLISGVLFYMYSISIDNYSELGSMKTLFDNFSHLLGL